MKCKNLSLATKFTIFVVFVQSRIPIFRTNWKSGNIAAFFLLLLLLLFFFFFTLERKFCLNYQVESWVPEISILP